MLISSRLFHLSCHENVRLILSQNDGSFSEPGPNLNKIVRSSGEFMCTILSTVHLVTQLSLVPTSENSESFLFTTYRI